MRKLLLALAIVSSAVIAAPSQELVSCLRQADQVWGWESSWGYHCQDVDVASPPGSANFQRALDMTVVERQRNFYAHKKNRDRGFAIRDKRDNTNPCKTSKVGTGYGFVGKGAARVELHEISEECFR